VRRCPCWRSELYRTVLGVGGEHEVDTTAACDGAWVGIAHVSIAYVGVTRWWAIGFTDSLIETWE
jgi:hypothetical protein